MRAACAAASAVAPRPPPSASWSPGNDFVGSDGHDLEKRPLSLRSAYEQVVALAGADEAQRLFAGNPRRVLAGQPVEAGLRTMARERPGMWAWLRQRLG